MHKVSIIIPIYKVEQYLKKCLNSVIAQTYKNLEIICVNDCSPDNSIKILQEYANKDTRIKIVNRTQNGGLSAARNSGLKIATGEYIYFLDSDDWIDYDYIEKMVNCIITNKTDIVLNISIIKEFDTHSEVQIYDDYNDLPEIGKFYKSENTTCKYPWMSWTHIYKRTFLINNNLFFPEGYNLEDIYYQNITHAYCNNIYVFKGAYYHYTQREDSIMKTENNIDVSTINIYKLLYNFYKSRNLLNNKKIKLFLLRNINNSFLTAEQFMLFKDFFSYIKIDVEKNITLYTQDEIEFMNDFLTRNYEYYKAKYKNPILLKLRRNIIKNIRGKNNA